MHRNHPGYDATNCHLRFTVTQQNPYGVVTGAEFGCEFTCGHCFPSDGCETRRKQMPESLMKGHRMATDRELYEIFEIARRGSDRPSGVLRGIHAVLEAVAPAAEKLGQLQETHDYFKQRSSQRHERLWHWAHEKLDEERKTEFFNIVANGVVQMYEEPTYAQIMNTTIHERDQALREASFLRIRLAEAERRQKALQWLIDNSATYPSPKVPVQLIVDENRAAELVTEGGDPSAGYRKYLPEELDRLAEGERSDPQRGERQGG
jgi:hypothetical protein